MSQSNHRCGFVFDLDGTIIDSLRISDKIEEALFERYEIEKTPELMEELKDVSIEILTGENRKNLGIKLMWAIFKKLGLRFTQKIGALIISSKIYKEEIKKVPLFPGTKEVFKVLEEEEIPFTIATTSSAEEVDDRLSRFPAFYGKFQGKIISRSSVDNLKPAPDQIKLAAELMDISPTRCIMIGDMASDIEMGKKVGATTIGVCTGFLDSKRFSEINPDFIFSSIAEIPDNLDKILEKVNSN
ncbi:MAG: HAD family hydrolase [Promethearchaeia archaeon]